MVLYLLTESSSTNMALECSQLYKMVLYLLMGSSSTNVALECSQLYKILFRSDRSVQDFFYGLLMYHVIKYKWIQFDGSNLYIFWCTIVEICSPFKLLIFMT